ncbi:hypothetical protein [uncultured Methanobrevibacter sp.]|uniref:hypothetical protein n=1 Tax=uncultured Methanobrevibacter sp. TaxID=253161 RepID=UPI0025CB9C83|nr:hypothetical protein [uncultured Methanobrevibacter sp.]
MEYFSKFEWEFLQEDLDLSTNYVLKSNLEISSFESCYLKRDGDYNLIFEIIGNINRESYDKLQENANVVHFLFENDEECIILNFCILHNRLISFNKDTGYKEVTEFKVKHVERTYKNNLNTVDCIKEFYLNSVRYKDIFSRVTNYYKDEKFLKVREWEEDKLNELKGISPKMSAGDHLLLDLDEFSFILQDIREFGPKWSNKLCIEYQRQFNIPSEEIRQKNREILSFLLGKHLIKVGETYFDNQNRIIKEIAMLPSFSPRINLKEACKRIEVPAISPNNFPMFNPLEKDLSRLIDAYLSENEIDLSYVLEYMTFSTTIPTEHEIIVIGGCLDELADIWFNSSKSDSVGELIKKDEFDILLKECLPIINEKLVNHPDVFKNIHEGYKITGYQKVKKFLDEVGISQGNAEKKARGYRNISAHGHEMSDETRLKMIYLTDVYRTFLNRIILKILGFEVYFDLTNYMNIQIGDHLPNNIFKKNYTEIKKFYDDLKKNGE